MTDSVISGKVFLRSGDSSLFKMQGACTSFSGLFGVSQNIPFYFLNYDNNTLLPNPTHLAKEGKSYEGVIYQLESPGVSIPTSRRCKFKFTKDFTYIETERNLTPLSNIAYVLYTVNDINYIAIPYSSVASLEFDYIL